jgi:hypothetical protein
MAKVIDYSPHADARKRAQEMVDMLNEKIGPLDHMPAWAWPEALLKDMAKIFYETRQFRDSASQNM